MNYFESICECRAILLLINGASDLLMSTVSYAFHYFDGEIGFIILECCF